MFLFQGFNGFRSYIQVFNPFCVYFCIRFELIFYFHSLTCGCSVFSGSSIGDYFLCSIFLPSQTKTVFYITAFNVLVVGNHNGIQPIDQTFLLFDRISKLQFTNSPVCISSFCAPYTQLPKAGHYRKGYLDGQTTSSVSTASLDL